MAAELQRMEHKGAAASITLGTGINSSDTTITLASTPSNWPTGSVGPFIIVIDPGQSGEEKVLISSRSGATLTVANSGRGFDDTTAGSHNSGATIEHGLGAKEIDDFNRHIYTTTDDDHTQYARTDGTRAITGNQTFQAGITVSSGGITVTGTDTETGNVVASGTSQATAHIATLTGTNGRYVGATNGAPATGTYLTDDFANDPTNGVFWVCTAGGSPGTWKQTGSGFVDTGWTTVTYSNSWVDYGSGYSSVGYRKVGSRVFLRGAMKSGTVGSAAFTLPTGYRPTGNIGVAVYSNNGSGSVEAVLTITSAGVATPTFGSNVFFSVDNVSFDTV